MFDVELDVDGTLRTMQLPYNTGADPWFAARGFLERNNLTQMYLDQVANFIMNQTKGMNITQEVPTMSDPFTGSTLLTFRCSCNFLSHRCFLQVGAATFPVSLLKTRRPEGFQIRSLGAVATFRRLGHSLPEEAI